MRTGGLALLGALCAALSAVLAAAQAPARDSPMLARPAPGMPVHVIYDLYAAGLNIAQVRTAYVIGADRYRMEIAYHTTGLADLFSHGENRTTIEGTWNGPRPRPARLFASGSWKGDPRRTDIDYASGTPVVLALQPADTSERMPIPADLLPGAIDNLSAMSALIRTVADTGTCALAVRAFDGHRVVDLASRTGGAERIGPYRDSRFTGETLRCDFSATPVAGMKRADSADARPFEGSIWFASPIAGGPPIPVRMSFETRWFGEAIMYMTSAERTDGMVVARAP